MNSLDGAIITLEKSRDELKELIEDDLSNRKRHEEDLYHIDKILECRQARIQEINKAIRILKEYSGQPPSDSNQNQ